MDYKCKLGRESTLYSGKLNSRIGMLFTCLRGLGSGPNSINEVKSIKVNNGVVKKYDGVVKKYGRVVLFLS